MLRNGMLGYGAIGEIMNEKIEEIRERWKRSKQLEDWSGQSKEDIDYLIAEYERLEKEKLNYITQYIEAAKYNKDMFDENMKIGAENERLKKENQKRFTLCCQLREWQKKDYETINKLQRVCDCAIAYVNANEDTPSIKLGYKRDLQQAIKEHKS